MTEQIKQIAERIKEIREISGISAETLATKLGITNDTYLKYESGNSDIPVGVIFEISELFNIELSVMLGGDNPKLRIYGVVRNGKGLKVSNEATSNNDIMLLYFTSGTTGMPKMVNHDFIYPLGHILTAKYWQNVEDDGLHFTVADTGWAKSAWGKIYGQWLSGSAVMTYRAAQNDKRENTKSADSGRKQK